MTWTKLDDGFHGHPKIRRAWRDRTALGLYVLAVNHATCYELDGRISPEFVEDQVPDQSERDRAVTVLIECGLWEPNGEGWVIHDFLKYQPSRAKLREGRERDAARKREERAR